MSDKEEIKPSVFYIPRNYNGYVNIFGMPVKTNNLMEGAIMGGCAAYGAYQLMYYYFWEASITVWVVVIAVCGAVPFVIGLLGINDFSFSQWVTAFFKYLRNRSVSIYNQRVREEDVSINILGSEDEKDVGGSVLNELVASVKSKMSERAAEGLDSSMEAVLEEMKNGNVYFQDDVGVVEKPDEYKSDSELKKEARIRAKEEKAEAKYRRKIREKMRREAEEEEKYRKKLQKDEMKRLKREQRGR